MVCCSWEAGFGSEIVKSFDKLFFDLIPLPGFHFADQLVDHVVVVAFS
jgi:hypothetical protein